MTDNTPLRVNGLLITAVNLSSETSHTHLSSSMFYFMPRALSVGSCLISRLATNLADSDLGIAALTSRLLLPQFVNRNLPLDNNSQTCPTNLIAFCIVSVDFIRSSTCPEQVFHHTIVNEILRQISLGPPRKPEDITVTRCYQDLVEHRLYVCPLPNQLALV